MKRMILLIPILLLSGCILPINHFHFHFNEDIVSMDEKDLKQVLKTVSDFKENILGEKNGENPTSRPVGSSTETTGKVPNDTDVNNWWRIGDNGWN